MSRVEVIGDATLYLGDCLEILPTLPKVDAVITDPPFGIAHRAEAKFGASWAESEIHGDRDVSVRDAAIDQFTCPVAAFGAWKAPVLNRAHTCLVWDKGDVGGMNFHAPFRQSWEAIYLRGKWPAGGMQNAIIRGHLIPTWESSGRTHPHEKPVSLLALLIDKSGATRIFDPFMGSGTTGVAAVQMGRSFIGCEIDSDHFATACRRIEQAYKQRPLFEAEPQPKPQQMEIGA